MKLPRTISDAVAAARRWVASRERLAVIISGIVALAIVCGGIVVFRGWGSGDATEQMRTGGTEAATAAAYDGPRRWIDGQAIASIDAQPAGVAIVVDNAPEARSQSGLAAASIVFEMPVEGRRTRFVAVYPLPMPDEPPCTTCASQDNGAIGPVRSARTYFVGLADALGVPLIHVGGSPTALALLARRRHVNQYYDSPFWRDHTRPAPFNVYTRIADLASFVTDRGWFDALLDREVLHPELWPYSTLIDEGLEYRDGSAVRIPFNVSDRAFQVAWDYDDVADVYRRSQRGVSHQDASGTQITAANVVVLEAPTRVLDAIGRLAIAPFEPPITASWEGFLHADHAAVLRGGQRVDGQWSWESTTSDGGLFGLRQRRETESGEPAFVPIALAPGRTWVEIVDEDVGMFSGE